MMAVTPAVMIGSLSPFYAECLLLLFGELS